MAKTIDDAVAELVKMVDLAKVSITLQEATLSSLLGGTAVSAPMPAGPGLGPIVFTPTSGGTPPITGLPPGYGPHVTAPPVDFGGGGGGRGGGGGGGVGGGGRGGGGYHPGFLDRLITSLGRTAGRGRRAGAALGKAIGRRTGGGNTLAAILGGLGGAVSTVAAAAPTAAIAALSPKVRAGARFGRHAGRRMGALGAKALGLGKGATRAVAAAGGAVGSVVGGVGAGIGLLAVAADEGRKALLRWNEGVMESAKRLGEVSGSMAEIAAQREVKDIVRDIQRGEATAASTRNVMESEAALKDALLPLETTFTNLFNELLTLLNQAVVPVLKLMYEGIEIAIESLASILDALGFAGAGARVRALLGGGAPPPGGMPPGVPVAFREAVIAAVAGGAPNLMGIARAAALGAGVVPNPLMPGAAPLGRLPIP